MVFDWSMIGAIATIIALLFTLYFSVKAHYSHKLQATISFCDFEPPFENPKFNYEHPEKMSPSEVFFSKTSYARTYICLNLRNKGERKICDINLICNFDALYYFDNRKAQLFYNKESAQIPDLLPNQSISVYILKGHLFSKDGITVAHKEGKAKIKYLLPHDHWLNQLPFSILSITMISFAFISFLTEIFTKL